MERFGFIHGELDTRILILFVLRRLPRPVDMNTLAELCFCDSGVGWFEYAECLAALVDNGHIEKLSGGRYLITETVSYTHLDVYKRQAPGQGCGRRLALENGT